MPISRVWRDGLCVIVAAFGLLAAVRGISYLLRLRKRRHGSATCVAFFPDPCTPCMAYLRTLCTHHPMLWPDNCGRRNCSHDHNLQYPFGRLLHSLAYAQSTIDVCVFVFTCSEIAETLAMLCRYRNIRVRVIVDGSQRNIVGSQLDTLDRVSLVRRLKNCSQDDYCVVIHVLRFYCTILCNCSLPNLGCMFHDKAELLGLIRYRSFCIKFVLIMLAKTF